MKKLKILGIILLTILVFMLVINVIPPKKTVENNLFISTLDRPMVIAHRGGAENNPENTLKAYKEAVYTIKTDVLELDVQMTKDNQLVCIHNADFNDTSDVEEIKGTTERQLVNDYTLAELRNFNFGYKFQDESGNYPYRDLVSVDDPNRQAILKENGLQIITLEEMFATFYNDKKDLLFSVEIKNKGELGIKAADIFGDLLMNKFPDYKNRTIVASFHQEVEAHMLKNYPELLISASTPSMMEFVITQTLRVNLFSKADFACLQIPTSYNVGIKFPLDQKTYIKRCHRKGIAVHYWTINTEEEMKELINLGCDGIMTDNPKLLNEILGKN